MNIIEIIFSTIGVVNNLIWQLIFASIKNKCRKKKLLFSIKNTQTIIHRYKPLNVFFDTWRTKDASLDLCGLFIANHNSLMIIFNIFIINQRLEYAWRKESCFVRRKTCVKEGKKKSDIFSWKNFKFQIKKKLSLSKKKTDHFTHYYLLFQLTEETLG